jgi:S-adenosylmethionine uptake transporter
MLSLPMSRLSHATLWFVGGLCLGVMNDGLSKALVGNYHSYQIISLRFLLSSVLLLPWACWARPRLSNHVGLHGLRGLLLTVAVILWTHGLGHVSLSTATLLNFTIPFFVILLSWILLREPMRWTRWAATVIGFLGVVVAMGPFVESSLGSRMTLLILVSCFLYACLDVLNKRFVSKESPWTIVWMGNLWTVVLSSPFALYVWQPVAWQDWGWLLGLGAGSNIVLYCLLRAFSLVDLSVLAPLRYIEFLTSAFLGYWMFDEIPTAATYCGAALIIPAACWVLYTERRITSPALEAVDGA